MKKILLLSDTHGTLDAAILRHAREADQIWHAGDIGSMAVAEGLAAVAPLRAVYGNADGGEIRATFPERLRFVEEGVEVLLKHIGGYPGHYDRSVQEELFAAPPTLFVCGHSHILKVMMDRRLGIMHFNPGAAGRYGIHHVRTLLRFTLDKGNWVPAPDGNAYEKYCFGITGLLMPQKGKKAPPFPKPSTGTPSREWTRPDRPTWSAK